MILIALAAAAASPCDGYWAANAPCPMNEPASGIWEQTCTKPSHSCIYDVVRPELTFIELHDIAKASCNGLSANLAKMNRQIDDLGIFGPDRAHFLSYCQVYYQGRIDAALQIMSAGRRRK